MSLAPGRSRSVRLATPCGNWNVIHQQESSTTPPSKGLPGLVFGRSRTAHADGCNNEPCNDNGRGHPAVQEGIRVAIQAVRALGEISRSDTEETGEVMREG